MAASIFPIISQASLGASIENQAAFAYRTEQEIRQGKQYYLATTSQVVQMMQLGNLAIRIWNCVHNSIIAPFALRAAANILPLVTFPIFLAGAAVKMGQASKIPLPLNAGMQRALSFLSDRATLLAQVAMLTGGVALAILGQPVFAGAVLTMFAYHRLDAHGYIPRKISLWMEIHLPILTSIGLLIGGGTLVTQLFAATVLIGAIPPINRRIQHLWTTCVAKIADKLFNNPLPITLSKYEQPVVRKDNMTAQEIYRVLDAREGDFELVLSHCSHPASTQILLPENTDLNQLLDLFNQVDWTKEYAKILPRLRDDERFWEFLTEKCPQHAIPKPDTHSAMELSKRNQQVDNAIQQLAQEKNLSKETFAANWVQHQMIGFVNNLLYIGNELTPGNQTDREEAIHNASKILAYLLKCTSPHEKHDILLKLAVEGGLYCPRAEKRVTEELVDQISHDQTKNLTPQQAYEIKILQSLQDRRKKYVQEAYRKIIDNQYPWLKPVGDDIHVYDLWRRTLSLGFYPLNDLDRNDLDIVLITLWQTHFSLIQEHWLNLYKRNDLNNAIHEAGDLHLTQYIQNYFKTNPLLTTEEKNNLLDKLTYPQNMDPFYQLLLVKLGVLRVCASR